MNLKFLSSIIVIAVFMLTLASCTEKVVDPEGDDSNATEYVTNGNTVTVTDHGEGTGTKTFTADKVWILNKFVFVNEGQTLTIEPGTVIKGKPGQGESASALIVARGAKIMAEGTATKPIIFTAEADDLNGSVAKTDKGLWGGVILLGKAQINTVPNKMNIEGIPTTEPRGEYGGDDDHDNSGVMKYVSIRHGGSNIGADNEINGLTFGAVGDGTIIEHIEVFANNDDGYEWFGGTVHTKWMISAYCKDDGFDWDQGYRGKGQFWLVVQDPDAGDRMGELDGADDPEDGTPLGGGVVYNATWIGRGAAAGEKVMTFRANGGGYFYNSIFVNQTKGVDIELKENLTASSSYKRFVDGQLKLENNMFYAVADQTTAGIFKINAKSGVSSADEATAQGQLDSYIATANNTVDVDPGITYPTSGNFGFNPIPTGNVSGNLASYPSDFENVTYKGAFDPAGSNWADGWTLLFN
jgi:hypothetical protein